MLEKMAGVGFFWQFAEVHWSRMFFLKDAECFQYITLRIQIYPKNPGFPLYSFSGDGIFRPSILLSGGVWILRVKI